MNLFFICYLQLGVCSLSPTGFETRRSRVKSDSKISWSPSGKECETMEIGDVCAQVAGVRVLQ